jgi:hypothetical protein
MMTMAIAGRLLTLLVQGRRLLSRLCWRGRDGLSLGRYALCLLDLQIIDNRLYALNRASVIRSSDPFGIIGDIASERHYTTGRLDSDGPALDRGIAINLVLHVTGHLRVGASWRSIVRASRQKRQS